LSTDTLGGDLKAHFAFGTAEEQAGRLEQARQEQEAMAGYPLVIKNTRQTHYINDKGVDVYEVWATFAPAPTPPPPSDGTQV
jgi:hypothetical protein